MVGGVYEEDDAGGGPDFWLVFGCDFAVDDEEADGGPHNGVVCVSVVEWLWLFCGVVEVVEG